MAAEATASRWGAAAKQEAEDRSRRQRVLVLGGGFGGLYTALQLAQQTKQDGSLAPLVTLVDKRDKFVFTPLLYELAGEDGQLIGHELHLFRTRSTHALHAVCPTS